MKTTNGNRFSPLELPSGKKLRNRVVVPPMASETADANGYVTEATKTHYSRLCKAGTGLVMVEYTYVLESGKSEPNQLGITSNNHILGLSEIARSIHDFGSLAGIQLTHSGGKTTKELAGGALMGPSNIAVPAKDREFQPPSPMSGKEIEGWKRGFWLGARRALEAGFDLVEFHAAHGYGLNQWLSPITNRREDQYGGNVCNNFTLLLEVVESVRESFPELLLAVRMPGQDFLPGGLSLSDGQCLARALEKRKIDLLDVSSGIGGWRRPSDREGQGYLIHEAEAIQSAVDVPVIGVGGIEHGDFIDELISKDKVRLAAVGRAILKDPVAWGRQNLSEHIRE